MKWGCIVQITVPSDVPEALCESGFVPPHRVFANPHSKTGVFGDLDAAYFEYLEHRQWMEAENMRAAFLRIPQGWVLVSCELNCWQALGQLRSHGVDDILGEEEAAERMGGTYAPQLQKLIAEWDIRPFHGCLMHYDQFLGSDFASLEMAVERAPHLIPGAHVRNAIFCRTPGGGWLIIACARRNDSEGLVADLRAHGMHCEPWDEARRERCAREEGDNP